ncbi:histone-lysine N-methyltransferase SETMAR [Trichonephila clavipes]|nr:histone-lysine N-methyltransferase SETMAR [Trichonephila clavipes]
MRTSKNKLTLNFKRKIAEKCDRVYLPHETDSKIKCTEGRKVRSGYLSFRTNGSALPITPKRSSSRDVGTSSYRYHTAAYSPASVSVNSRTNNTIFVASIPDLTPSDFHLFLHLKSFLAGKHFNNDKELKENVSNSLKTQVATFYEEGIEKLVPRYDTCLQNFGSFVER